MKLASYNNGRRDGQLMLVSRDLTQTVAVPAIAHTMQQLLDGWELLKPQLQELYDALNEGKLPNAQAFDENYRTRKPSMRPNVYHPYHALISGPMVVPTLTMWN